jgi:hypothetical protein
MRSAPTQALLWEPLPVDCLAARWGAAMVGLLLQRSVQQLALSSVTGLIMRLQQQVAL